MKNIWQHRCEWDSELSSNILEEWMKLQKDLSQVPEIEFLRKVLDEISSYVLQFFCYSSMLAYAFVVYTSCSYTNENQFMFAKFKVAPVNITKHIVFLFGINGCYISFKMYIFHFRCP